MTLVCDLNSNEKLLDEAEHDLKNSNNNSPIQDYVHLDDQTQPTSEMALCFKPLTILRIITKTKSNNRFIVPSK